MTCGFLSTWQHTANSEQTARDVELAIKRAGLDKAAELQGLDASQWSRQLAGRGAHVSLWRLSELPPEFWVEFVKIRARRCGLMVLKNDLAMLVLGVRKLLRSSHKKVS